MSFLKSPHVSCYTSSPHTLHLIQPQRFIFLTSCVTLRLMSPHLRHLFSLDHFTLALTSHLASSLRFSFKHGHYFTESRTLFLTSATFHLRSLNASCLHHACTTSHFTSVLVSACTSLHHRNSPRIRERKNSLPRRQK